MAILCLFACLIEGGPRLYSLNLQPMRGIYVTDIFGQKVAISQMAHPNRIPRQMMRWLLTAVCEILVHFTDREEIEKIP
jgi:hypothetical protein